jgi:hypothetical protein
VTAGLVLRFLHETKMQSVRHADADAAAASNC